MVGFYEPRTYVIEIREHLDETWSDWFEGMSLSYKGDATILTGKVSDNASLHGILERIHDLNLTIQSLEYLPGDSPEFQPGSK